jgi:hypothetical protein
MNKANEKTVLDAANIENGESGQLSFGEVWLPGTQSITNVQKPQGISALLLHGEANAVPMSYLVSITGQTPREIRRRVQLERQAWACICVNNRDGYYLAENEDERDACARSMLRRALEVYKTAQAIERAEVERP